MSATFVSFNENRMVGFHQPWLWLLAVSLTTLLAACGKAPENAGSSLMQQKPSVEVSQPLQRDIVEWDEYNGRLEAVESVEVRARVSGYLNKILFKDGGKVKKNDLLFEIDPRPYIAQLNQAKAQYDQAKSKRELAQGDFQRAKRLLREQAISEEEYDTRSKNVVQSEAALQSAKAMVELAQLNVDYTQIHSPIDGRISRKLITVGNLVSADSTLLATIVSVDPIYLYLDADERSVLKYTRLGIAGKRQSAVDHRVPLEMSLIDEQDFPHKGYIDYVAPEINPATGTVRARAVFTNPDELLKPGLFGRVRVPGSGKYVAQLLSDKAIGMDQGKQYVMVLSKDNKAEYRPITTGAMHEGLRIVTNGLAQTDWVIVNGLQFVRPGAEVQATQKPMPESH
ncbi:efflux pump periplasmic linker BepF [Methyloglobulus morosus KoM1]|uniref:Efflux pump periplasmic linker BepF n=1 Tax=Methyloglobulus morosus KoM1 TaxID=1116472 RepID=V5C6H1_9GAMM|nr:efflux RND transporter periplasmic adaptor subunit [Methyloglobulus morosus]ESS74022.1 efflux pump periplasmic linker BepF [Methyloglobulus morosus KoM1]